MTTRLVWLAGLIGLAACSPVPGDPGIQPVARCSAAFCGGNSPEIGHYGLHELSLDHLPNAEGFELLAVSQDAAFFDLEVVAGALVALHPARKTLAGQGLVGARLWLRRGSSQYAVVIAGVGRTTEVVPPYGEIESYVLDWADVVDRPLAGVVRGGELAEQPALGKARRPVCPDAGPWDLADAEWDESIGMAPFDTVVFEGDRIDAKRRTVEPAADDRWFNLGCARHTLAKLRLTRNTLHTVASGDWRQVQATLKMLSADYCGTGRELTVAGEPLVWRNRVGMEYWARPGELEARWDEHGAICLDTPRLASTTSALAQAQFPDIEKAIAAACPRPPRCKRPDPDVFAEPGELITSGNY